MLEAETDALPGVQQSALWRVQAAPAAATAPADAGAVPAAPTQPWLLLGAADPAWPERAAPVWRVSAQPLGGTLQVPALALARAALAPGARAWAVPLRPGSGFTAPSG